MSEVVVRELWRFPVKGCQGVAADEIEVGRLGIPGDRSFVLWHEGKLVDQIETPMLAAIAASLDPTAGTLVFSNSEHGEYEHRIRSQGPALDAKWVLDEFQTIDQGDEVAAWLGAVLGKEVRLVSPGAPWKINFPIEQMKLLHEREKQSFFSASPVSLSNIASLHDLNRHLETPVPMNRFRMNVVVEGLEPYQENEIVSLSNDDVKLLQVTAAERCVIVTTDQETGSRPKSDLLKKMRLKPMEDRFGSGRIFGSYMTVGRAGVLRVGDRLEVA